MKYIPIGYFNNIAFGPETELSLVIDSTSNLADTKTQLDILVSTDLKDLLLPFYGSEAKYEEKVRVIENDTERPYSMLTTFNLSSKNCFVFAFIDEATPYGDIYTTAYPTITADINTLVAKVLSYKNEYRGFIFRIKDTGDDTFGESQKLREILNAVHSSHIPYNNTSYKQIQLPVTREDQIFNRLDIAADSELTRFAAAANTVMVDATRYKYYGYEIVDALNQSIASLNIKNDYSSLISNIESKIPSTSQDAFNMPITNIASKISYNSLRGTVSQFTVIGSKIIFTNQDAFNMILPNISSKISSTSQDAFNISMTNIASTISYASLNGIAQ
jgi:hypothetical protein